MRCVCEGCGKVREFETSDEAYQEGWDWPPNMGAWGVVSPRNCGDCTIVTTAWWAIMQKEGEGALDDHAQATVERIVLEKYLQEHAWDEKFDDPKAVRAALKWYIGEENGDSGPF